MKHPIPAKTLKSSSVGSLTSNISFDVLSSVLSMIPADSTPAIALSLI